MVGRTHGIHAEPTAVGLFFVGVYAEMDRNRRRLQRALEGIAFGKIAGAVGVYGNVTPEVEQGALSSLGLSPEPCATQVVPRDRHAELFSVMAQIASSIERIAVQVRHWQRTEVGEASEAFSSKQKGSSAMPHKRNPILSENLCGLARLMRSYAQAALENVALWHERDISHSSVERVIAPDATCLLDFMFHRTKRVVDGLQVDPKRLQQNLDLTGGLIYSEAIMLSLVRKGLGRQQAYEIVQKQALSAHAGKGDFRALLEGDDQVMAHLSKEELDTCFAVEHHLKHVGHIFDRVLGGGSRAGQ